MELTAIDSLLDKVLDGALVHGGDVLRLERLAVFAGLEHALVVHGLLERIALPAEQVVGVGSVALGVAERQLVRVGAVGGPQRVEACQAGVSVSPGELIAGASGLG